MQEQRNGHPSFADAFINVGHLEARTSAYFMGREIIDIF
jgi:hypothetical protein